MAKKKRRSMRGRVKEDSQRSASGNNHIKLPQGVGFFTAEPGGRCKIEILPYTVSDPKHPDRIEIGEIWYKRPYRQHRNVGVNKDTEICPRTLGKPCPICEHRESMLAGKNTDKEVIKSLKAQDRVLYNVRPLSGSNKGKIQVWEFSYHNFQKQLDAEVNDPDNEEFAGFADLEGGYALRIRFAEETFERNKFAKTERIDFDPKPDLNESILNEVVDLDSTLVVKQYKDLQNKFFEIDDDEDEKNETGASAEEEEEVKGAKSEKQAPKGADDTPTEKQIKKMKRKELAEVIKIYELDAVDPDDYDDMDELRDAVIIELHGAEEEEVADPEPETKAEPPKSAKASEGKKKETGTKCPHGHTWGEADEHEECDDCDKWDNCIADAS